jgi:hypothetical protein
VVIANVLRKSCKLEKCFKARGTRHRPHKRYTKVHGQQEHSEVRTSMKSHALNLQLHHAELVAAHNHGIQADGLMYAPS